MSGTLQVATFTDANINAPAGDFTATITWGDGATTQNATIVALGNGQFGVRGAHLCRNLYAVRRRDP